MDAHDARWFKVEHPAVPIDLSDHQHPDDPHQVQLRHVYSNRDTQLAFALDVNDGTRHTTVALSHPDLAHAPLTTPATGASPDQNSANLDVHDHMRELVTRLLSTPAGIAVLASAVRDLDAIHDLERDGRMPATHRRGRALLAAMDAGIDRALHAPIANAAQTWDGTTADLLHAFTVGTTA